MKLDDIMKSSCTDQMENAWDDFAINEEPIVPKKYKVTTLSHKQNKPVVSTVTKKVDKT